MVCFGLFKTKAEKKIEADKKFYAEYAEDIKQLYQNIKKNYDSKKTHPSKKCVSN
jgi:hypothetical protein